MTLQNTTHEKYAVHSGSRKVLCHRSTPVCADYVPWRFITSSSRMASSLNVFRCPHGKDFKHAEISGSLTPKTAEYPEPLCRHILSSLFGDWKNSVAMPVVKLEGGAKHREK